jgi:hypothetical protein
LFISSANVTLFLHLGKFPQQNRCFPFAYCAKLLNFASGKLKNRKAEKAKSDNLKQRTYYESKCYYPYDALGNLLQRISSGRRHVLLLFQEEDTAEHGCRSAEQFSVKLRRRGRC